MTEIEETPALVIDVQVMARNIDRLHSYAKQHNLNVRPHTKTHKSLRIARMQLAAGATGLTTAKVGEARIMADVCDDLFVAYPAVDPARAKALADLAGPKKVRVAIDSIRGIEVLQRAAAAAGTQLEMLVDIDVGHHRTGVQSPTEALKLAEAIDRASNLNLDGLFLYPGHIRAAADQQAGPMSEIRAIVDATVDAFRRSGLNTSTVSGGSTPSAFQSHLIPALTEIRPGTYVFNDMSTASGGYCTLDDCAARIVCTVVSDAVPGKFVIDAGSKTLSSDRNSILPDSGYGHVVEYPQARIVRLTEEHGEVDVSRSERRPRVGERITVIPNHICPCINLQDSVWLRNTSGDLEPLRVDARGMIR